MTKGYRRYHSAVSPLPAHVVEALAAQTELAERRRNFVAAAAAAEKEVVRDGVVCDADEVFGYLRDKLASRRARRPPPDRPGGR